VLSVVFLPLLMWLTLRPDWFNFQNGLDPYFYTGYAQNLDDALAIAGGRWYFVSRWSIYLPNRLFGRVFGYESGFIIFHYLLLVLVVASIYFAGRNRWSRAACLLASVVALSTPMLIRAVLGDYSDSIAVPFGAVLIVALCTASTRRASATVAGVSCGLILVANPFSATIAGTALLAGWLPQKMPFRKRVEVLGLFGLGALAVIASGLVLFRWRYGIDNIYKPTIDFLRSDVSRNSEQNADGWYWLRYRLWIYAPLLVLAAWVYLARVTLVAFDASERALLRVLAAQYALHLVLQFVFDQVTLEVPFYWSYIVPSFVLGSAVVIARSVGSTDGRWVLALAGSVLLVLAVLPSPSPELFPSWAIAVIAVAVSLALVSRFGSRFSLLLPVLMIALTLELQLGTPRPESQPLELVYDPAYSTVFHPDHSPGEETFRAAKWFVDEMDVFGDPVERDMYFWIGEGDAHRLAAMYEAHVSGRWINAGWRANATGRTEIPTETAANFRAGLYPHLAVIGSSDQVDSVVPEFLALRPDAVTIFDQLAPSRVQTRVVVLQLPGQGG
jgi:4-amino-4-deoxy-L-arabinose transferase-like glycosyltransferase